MVQPGIGTLRKRLPFPLDVDQYPAPFPLLNLFDRNMGQLIAAQPAPNQHSQQSPVADCPEAFAGRSHEESLRLFEGEPGAEPPAFLAYAGNGGDRGRLLMRKKSARRSFPGQAAERG